VEVVSRYILKQQDWFCKINSIIYALFFTSWNFGNKVTIVFSMKENEEVETTYRVNCSSKQVE
jgi:hypothetical protein